MIQFLLSELDLQPTKSILSRNRIQNGSRHFALAKILGPEFFMPEPSHLHPNTWVFLLLLLKFSMELTDSNTGSPFFTVHLVIMRKWQTLITTSWNLSWEGEELQ